MKQDVSPGVVAVIVVILVAIIGFFAFKKFGTNSNPALAADAKRDAAAKAMNLKGMGNTKPQLGSNPASSGMPAGRQ